MEEYKTHKIKCVCPNCHTTNNVLMTEDPCIDFLGYCYKCFRTLTENNVQFLGTPPSKKYELEPCPFCNATEPNYLSVQHDTPATHSCKAGVVFVKCDKCGTKGPSFPWGDSQTMPSYRTAAKKAKDAWNRRPTQH